jgi:hypothetical protein
MNSIRPAFFVLAAVAVLAGCAHSDFVVRPVSRIVADSVGQSISLLQDTFGEPRKVDTSTSKQVYVWFIATEPSGAPTGFHGCEMEVTVDARSQRILGYSLSNLGWGSCGEVQRKIRIAAR